MHEHRRPDRDNFVTIEWSNIVNSWSAQYLRDDWVDNPTGDPVCSLAGNPDGTDYNNCVSGTKTTAFGLTYDPDSIMHYPRISV